MKFSKNTKFSLLGLLFFAIFATAAFSADEQFRLLWGEKTEQYKVELKYDKSSNVVLLDYNRKGLGGHEKWKHQVGSFEQVALAQSVLAAKLSSLSAPERVLAKVQENLEGLKYVNSGSCRVLHFPVEPISGQSVQNYFGIVELLSKRSLASIDKSIYRTQKLFQIMTNAGEEFEVLVALNEAGRIQAVSINKDGNSLAANQVEVSEDGVIIKDSAGKELFSYMIEHDVAADSGFDEVWLSVFSPQNALGLTQKENFRIHTLDGQFYRAYRYKSLQDLDPEEFVRFDQSEPIDPSVAEAARLLAEQTGLTLVLEDQVAPCPDQYECSMNLLIEKVYAASLLNNSFDMKEHGSLKEVFTGCLKQEGVIDSFGPKIVAKKMDSEKLLQKLGSCQQVLSIGVSESSVDSFLKSRFLTLNNDGKVKGIFSDCMNKSYRALVSQCVESLTIFQDRLVAVQPSFHHSFLQETDHCLSESESGLNHQLQAMIACVDGQKAKYAKAQSMDEFLSAKESFPALIKDRLSAAEMASFLDSCEDQECIKAYLSKSYQDTIIPSLLQDYVGNGEDRQRLTNRLMRGLRRITRQSSSAQELAQKLQEFEASILETAMNQGLEEMLLEEMFEKDPSLFSKDESGRIVRAAENYNYQRDEEMVWMDFLSHMHIPLLSSFKDSLSGYLHKAIQEKGIYGGKVALNQLMKDFYLWSSERRNAGTLSLNGLYEGKELAYRLEDIAEEVEECFDGYAPTQQGVRVQEHIDQCEIKRWKTLTFYKGKKLFETEISKYFDLESIKANELMGVNRFLKRCLRDQEKASHGIDEYKTGAMHCVTVAYIDLKQNIYKYQAIDKNLTQLAPDNEIYADSFKCLKETLLQHDKVSSLDDEAKDGVERLMDYSYTAPTTIRFMSSIFSSVGYDSIENYETYRSNLNSYMKNFNVEDCRELIQNLEEGCFAGFESGRVQAVRDGIIKLAGLDSLNVTTNLNESAKEVFADAIDLELVQMLLSDDYLLNEEFFQLRLAGNSPETQYIDKKMTIDFLVNTVNGISNLLKEGFYSDPDQAKTALVTFSSRLKELIQIAEANQRPFHMHDLLGVLQDHALFDTLAIGFLSKYMRRKLNASLLSFRDEQIDQMNFRIKDVQRLVEGEIRSEHINMRNAIFRALRNDKTFRTAGLYSSSSDPAGRKIIELIKEKVILPQLLGGEPTVETFDDLDAQIVGFFGDRQNSAIFFADGAREFKNNVYLLNRERNRMGNGASGFFHLKRYREDFLDKFDTSARRTQYIHKLSQDLFVEAFRKNHGHFKDILSDGWADDSQAVYDLMREIAK